MKYIYLFLALHLCAMHAIKGNAEIITISYAIAKEYKACKEVQNSSCVITSFGSIQPIEEDNDVILKTTIFTNEEELLNEPTNKTKSIKEKIINRVKLMREHNNIGKKIDDYTKITEVKRVSEYDHGVEIICETNIAK